MIFVDTNVIIAYLTQPVTERDIQIKDGSRALMISIRDGAVQAITSDVVLHELAYVLTTPTRLNLMDIPTFCNIIRSIFEWRGWRMSDEERDIIFAACDLFQAHPKLEFSDALISARATSSDAELATWDKRLRNAHHGSLWESGTTA